MKPETYKTWIVKWGSDCSHLFYTSYHAEQFVEVLKRQGISSQTEIKEVPNVA
jgi:hypothetical protein